MTKSPLMDKRERLALGLGSDSTLDRLEARGLFPKRLTLTPGSRSVFWRRIEVEQWLRERGVEIASAPSTGA